MSATQNVPQLSGREACGVGASSENSRETASGVRPIHLGHFTLTATDLEVQGKPSFEEYQAVGDNIARAHKAEGWWAADWIAYGESREDWQDKLSQAVHAEKYTEATVKQHRYVAKNVPPSRRLDGVRFSLHCEVARLARLAGVER